jgi:uncharacterized membrane protein YeaQ/YmgE (transglycosylase-associated protein family)
MLRAGEIMNLLGFAERTQIWPRLRRALLTFWLPLVLLAVVPVIIVLLANVSWGIILAFVCGAIAGIIGRWLTSGPKDLKEFILTTMLGTAGAFLSTFVIQDTGWFQGASLIVIIGAVVAMLIWTSPVVTIRSKQH